MRTSISDAKTFWAAFVEMCDRQDEALVDLYAPDCLIYEDVPGYRNTVKTGAEYLPAVRAFLQAANRKGRKIVDSTFRQVAFVAEGDRVRITSIRHSNLKGFDSPFSLLVEKAAHGRILIREERMEHRLQAPLRTVEITVTAKKKRANRSTVN